MASKFGKLMIDDFMDEDIKEKKIEEPEVVPAKEKKVEEIMPAPVKEEEPAPKAAVEKKTSAKEDEDDEPAVERKTTKKRGAKKKLDEDLKADFLQIDIRGMRDYLSTITSYESMKNGDKVSFNTYIRGLIEKDMKKNASTYEQFKKLFE